MRRLHLIVIAVAILAAGLAAGGPAFAQPAAADTASKQEQARKLFDEAEGHKRRGDEHTARGEQQEARDAYGLAAEGYSKAFELYEHPAFIYNLAQMRRLRGELRRAIRAYETYLVLAPDGAQAKLARDFIAQLTLELDAQESQQGAQPGTDTTTPSETNGASTTPTEPASGEETAPGPDGSPAPVPSDVTGSAGLTATASPRRDAGRGLRVAGMVSAALGLAGLGLGMKFGLDARSASQDLSEKPPGDPWDEGDRQRIQSGQDAERNMIISLSLGGAALVAGGVLYGFGVVQGASSGLAVHPTATPDGVWVHLSGHF